MKDWWTEEEFQQPLQLVSNVSFTHNFVEPIKGEEMN